LSRWSIARPAEQEKETGMKNATAQFVGEPTQTFAAEPVSEAHNCIRAIVGASSGNLVEWFDFYAYAFTSIYFASTFFPSGDATSQQAD
jgi:MHS family alpha-ketoglutarate permease-like MFS transporter